MVYLPNWAKMFLMILGKLSHTRYGKESGTCKTVLQQSEELQKI